MGVARGGWGLAADRVDHGDERGVHELDAVDLAGVVGREQLVEERGGG